MAVLVVSSRGITDAVERTAGLLALLVPAAAILAGIGGGRLARRALAPVSSMTRRAEGIGAADLAQRIEVPASDDEVGRLARTLNGMLDRIEEAVRRNTRFVSDASHEIRNPLTNLSSEIQILLRKERDGEEYRAGLTSLAEEVRRLARICDGHLYLARADARADAGTSGRFSMSEIVRATAIEFAADSERAGVRLDVEATETAEVGGDPEAARRIMRNLLENAIRYSPRGAAVEVRVSSLEGRSVVTVSDRGIGVSDEDLPHLFERFFRGERARETAPEGAGLGLSIVREAATILGASVEVNRPEGGGTKFSVFFPSSSSSLHPPSVD